MNNIVHEMTDDLVDAAEVSSRPWDDQVLPHHEVQHGSDEAGHAADSNEPAVRQLLNPDVEEAQVAEPAPMVEQGILPDHQVELVVCSGPAVEQPAIPSPIVEQLVQSEPVEEQVLHPDPVVEHVAKPAPMVDRLVHPVSAGVPVAKSMMSPVEALKSDAGQTAEQGNAFVAGKDKGSLAVFGRANARHGFRIGVLQLMIRHEESSQIAEIEAIHRLPNAPSWFRGVTNLHGKLTPIFDLAPYMGLNHGVGRQMLLVLDHGTDATGIIIDGLLERLHLPVQEDSNLDAAPMRLTPHLRGASMVDGKVWYDLDVRSLLAELEQSVRSG